MPIPNTFNRLPARPEHMETCLEALKSGARLSPTEISRTTGLTLTQASCALNKLETLGKIGMEKQPGLKPRLVVFLLTENEQSDCS